MAQAQAHSRIGRSVVALFAGFAVVVVLSVGMDVSLRKIGLLPPLGRPMANSLFLLATGYRTVFGVIGSYITATLAPYRPMEHALLGGAIGLVLSIIGAAVTWNNGPDFGPHWYPLSLIALALPQSWLGGELRRMQLRARPLSSQR